MAATYSELEQHEKMEVAKAFALPKSGYRFIVARLGGEVTVEDSIIDEASGNFRKVLYDIPSWLGAIAYCAGIESSDEDISRLSAGISYQVLRDNDWGEGQ